MDGEQQEYIEGVEGGGVVERVRAAALGRECAEEAREGGEEREAVNGGQGRRVLPGQGAAGSAALQGKRQKAWEVGARGRRGTVPGGMLQRGPRVGDR